MFPTPVGMNRKKTGKTCIVEYVPHTRGDEPLWYGDTSPPTKCSPHPWG